MDPSDDYLDEMGRLTPHEIEAILAGRETGDPATEPLRRLSETFVVISLKSPRRMSPRGISLR